MSTTHEGVNKFNRLAATVFSELYESFPDPTDLTSEALGSMAAPEGADAEEVMSYQQSAASVVAWLADEGLLRFEGAVYGGYLQVILTMKALTILGSVPQAVRAAEEPLIDRLKGAMSKGATEAAIGGVKNALGAIFDLALRYGNSATSASTISV